MQLVAVFTDQMHRYSLVNTLCQAKQSTCGAVIHARSEMKDLIWHHDGEEDEMSSKELWKIFSDWTEISWDRMSDRSYYIDAQPMEIQG